ncbi:MAG: ABC transporter permease, partial [Actinobacteria bacterium]|nr:ABC transporter permease [Actinomycetota bacterium]
MKSFFMKVFSRREIVLLFIIVLLSIIVGSISKKFFTIDNFRAIMVIVSVHTIVACAMTVLMISGGFDISVGSVLAFLSIILGIFLNKGTNIIISIIITVLIGILIGYSIGFIISKLNVNPFITTLGAMFIFKGLAVGFAFLGHPLEIQRLSLGNFPKAFNNISGGRFHGVEYIVFYMIGILVIFSIFLSYNKSLRQNFYVGGNENAARLVGIKVDRLKIFNYALMGLIVAITTVVKVSRYKFAVAVGSDEFPLEIIAAVIIGGASLRGGEGSILGSFL